MVDRPPLLEPKDQQRLQRVLELAESLLEELVAEAPSPEVFERCHAFTWDSSRGPGRLVPVEVPARFDLDDLLGVEPSLSRLVRNTEQFLEGLPANHVLLYGERGTGKSSAVKGVLHRFGDRGLRLVEVRREDLIHLPRILRVLRADGNLHRFVIFCDDLSFGTGESGFRELKAALEGSLDAPPGNVCIVATSNRRHLLPESMADNRKARLDDDNELHLGEALEERLALSDRFGLVIGFYSFDQATYLEIVEHYLKQAGLELDDGLRAEALRFTVVRASRSGRAARQFVDDYVGRLGLR
jgi:predicted AAA+ superfamily ATPase